MKKTVICMLVLFGCGAPQSGSESRLEMSERKCADGSGWHCSDLAYAYYMGEPWAGDERQREKSLIYYLRSCELGEDYGCRWAAVSTIEIAEPGFEKKLAPLCDRSPSACTKIANAYRRGSSGLSRDPKYHRRFYLSACDRGKHFACFHYANTYWSDKNADWKVLASHYKISCLKEHTNACINYEYARTKSAEGRKSGLVGLRKHCESGEQGRACYLYAKSSVAGSRSR